MSLDAIDSTVYLVDFTRNFRESELYKQNEAREELGRYDTRWRGGLGSVDDIMIQGIMLFK